MNIGRPSANVAWKYRITVWTVESGTNANCKLRILLVAVKGKPRVLSKAMAQLVRFDMT